VTESLWAIVLGVALATGSLLMWNRGRLPRGVRGVGQVADVSVIIPARNEQLSLPLLLRSLGELDPRPREVIVVDDQSDDDTALVARAAGVTVVSAGEPPPGWTGKAWACHRGVEESSASMLLFLDADTVLASPALGVLLAVQSDHGGLVSVQPFHRTVRAYEQVSAYFNLVPVMASAVLTGRPSARAMAFGPCLLTSRRDYLASGGHAAVRAEILDDARLAGAYASVGLPVVCRLGGDLVAMRMYPGGPRQLVEGWSKNVASGASQAGRLTTAAATFWVCGHWLVAGAVAAFAVAAVTPRGFVPTVPLPLLMAGWVAAALQLRALLRRVGSFRWWTWAFFPVPLIGFGAIFAWSVVLTTWRREVRWRGRAVPAPGSALG
jgi:hypothetical protein